MARVYFKAVESLSDVEGVSQGGREVLERLLLDEGLALEGRVPLKVHFGEEGNATFIPARCYNGIISLLKEKNVEPYYLETNVLYRGQRTTRGIHTELARSHGFTQIPVEIADGEHGEDYAEVAINKKHFQTCKIGAKYSGVNQILVISHFKGHIIAKFGGALKQLGMGFAARGGKLAMHANAHPTLNFAKCDRCELCVKECPVDAINLRIIPRVSPKVCIGCATCIAVCPKGAMTINWASTTPKAFREKLVEYAYAGQLGKEAVYINFALNITKHCDCMNKNMKPLYGDLGILASRDPVAVDQASLDLLDKRAGKKTFGGRDQLDYAEKIGLGSKRYELIEL